MTLFDAQAELYDIEAEALTEKLKAAGYDLGNIAILDAARVVRRRAVRVAQSEHETRGEA